MRGVAVLMACVALQAQLSLQLSAGNTEWLQAMRAPWAEPLVANCEQGLPPLAGRSNATREPDKVARLLNALHHASQTQHLETAAVCATLRVFLRRLAEAQFAEARRRSVVTSSSPRLPETMQTLMTAAGNYEQWFLEHAVAHVPAVLRGDLIRWCRPKQIARSAPDAAITGNRRAREQIVLPFDASAQVEEAPSQQLLDATSCDVIDADAVREHLQPLMACDICGCPVSGRVATTARWPPSSPRWAPWGMMHSEADVLLSLAEGLAATPNCSSVADSAAVQRALALVETSTWLPAMAWNDLTQRLRAPAHSSNKTSSGKLARIAGATIPDEWPRVLAASQESARRTALGMHELLIPIDAVIVARVVQEHDAVLLAPRLDHTLNHIRLERSGEWSPESLAVAPAANWARSWTATVLPGEALFIPAGCVVAWTMRDDIERSALLIQASILDAGAAPVVRCKSRSWHHPPKLIHIRHGKQVRTVAEDGNPSAAALAAALDSDAVDVTMDRDPPAAFPLATWRAWPRPDPAADASSTPARRRTDSRARKMQSWQQKRKWLWTVRRLLLPVPASVQTLAVGRRNATIAFELPTPPARVRDALASGDTASTEFLVVWSEEESPSVAPSTAADLPASPPILGADDWSRHAPVAWPSTHAVLESHRAQQANHSFLVDNVGLRLAGSAAEDGIALALARSLTSIPITGAARVSHDSTSSAFVVPCGDVALHHNTTVCIRIEGLRPATTVVFRVAIILGENGTSSFSLPSPPATTRPLEPPGSMPPPVVESIVRTGASLRFELPQDDGGLPILAVVVFRRVGEASVLSSEMLLPPVQSAHVRGISSAMNQSFVVAAVNALGIGTLSEATPPMQAQYSHEPSVHVPIVFGAGTVIPAAELPAPPTIERLHWESGEDMARVADPFSLAVMQLNPTQRFLFAAHVVSHELQSAGYPFHAASFLRRSGLRAEHMSAESPASVPSRGLQRDVLFGPERALIPRVRSLLMEPSHGAVVQVSDVGQVITLLDGASAGSGQASRLSAWASHWSPRSFDVRAEIVASIPLTGMFEGVVRPPRNAAAFRGRVVVFARGGGIPLAYKVRIAASHGALAAVIVDHDGRCDNATFTQACAAGADKRAGTGWAITDDPAEWREARIPALLVSRLDGNKLLRMAAT